MAVVLHLNNITNLPGGKVQRFCKMDFRGSVKTTKSKAGKDMVTFNEEFQWPIGRHVGEEDFLKIRVMMKLMGRTKEIGRVSVCLQELVHAPDCTLRLSENLVNSNNSRMNTMVTFVITYHSPDSRAGEWYTNEFSYDSRETSGESGSELDERVDGKGEETPGMTTEEEEDTDFDLLANSYAVDLVKAAGMDEEEIASTISELSPEDIYRIEQHTRINEIRHMASIDPTIHKNEDFQVMVTIIEARYLAGTNLNPYVEVQVGDQIQKSEPEYFTCNPCFNKFFGFDFCMPRHVGLDQILCIRVFTIGNLFFHRWYRGRLVGEFRMDLRTVYEQEGHSFCSRWVVLVDPSDGNSGSRGYVKCHIYFVIKGESFSAAQDAAMKLGVDTLEDIEKGLILGMESRRPLAEFAVKIYQAEDLPSMSTDFVQNLRQSLFGIERPPVEAYVEVNFAGHNGLTKVKANTYNPEWNEEILFTELFPPLSNRIRIRVMDKTLGTDDNIIATHFINLDEISDPGEHGFMPIYGPCWVNLYGCPRKYTSEHWFGEDKELNAGQGEGVAYRGRLLMAIKTRQTPENPKIGVKTVKLQTILKSDCCGPKEDFVLFASIFEASVIDPELAQQQVPITFEVTCGVFGNQIDGRPEVDSKKSKRDTHLPPDLADPRSYTSPMVPKTIDEEYYYLDIANKIECMYFCVPWEDYRKRLYMHNLMNKIAKFLETSLDEIREEYKVNPTRPKKPFKHMRSVCNYFGTIVSQSMQAYQTIKVTGKKISLEKFKGKAVRYTVEKLKKKTRQIKTEISPMQIYSLAPDELADLFEKTHRELRSIPRVLKAVGEMALMGPPDVFIWMLDGSHNRIAYSRIKIHDLIHSDIEEMRGSSCGKMTTVFLRKPGRKGTGRSGWSIQAQLKIYIWFGLYRNVTNFRMGLPDGFKMTKDKPTAMLPRFLEYEKKCYFQFRAYIYLARKLLASDDSGLSDPYARIVIREHVVTSRIQEETLNPIWDQTLVIERITFYSTPKLMVAQPPTVEVEIFDYDDEDDPEFIGRTVVSPNVVIFEEKDVKPKDRRPYVPPTLKWWTIGRNDKQAGELLACFELVQMRREDEDEEEEQPVDEENEEVEWEFPFSYPQHMIDATKIPTESKRTRAQAPDNVSLSSAVSGKSQASNKSLGSAKLAQLTQKMKDEEEHAPKFVEADTPSGKGGKKKVIVIPIPPTIRPKLAKYRVEIMFWGLRNMRSIVKVTKPKVQFQWLGQIKDSKQMVRFEDCPNFPNPITHIDVELPVDTVYWPPISIRCLEERSYGRERIYIGSHSIVNVTRYLKQDGEEKRKKERKQARENKKNMVTRFVAGTVEDEEEEEKKKPPKQPKLPEPTAPPGSSQQLDDQGRPLIQNPRRVVFEEKKRRHRESAHPSALPNQLSADTVPGMEAYDKEPPSLEQVFGLSEDQEEEADDDDDDDDDGGAPVAVVKTEQVHIKLPEEEDDDEAAKLKRDKVKAPPLEPGKAVAFEKRIKFAPADLEELDWWSKYYASVESNELELSKAQILIDDEKAPVEQREEALEKFNELKVEAMEEEEDVISVLSEATTGSLLEGIEVDSIQTDKDSTTILEVPDDAAKRNKKKWWQRLRLRRKKKEDEEPPDLMMMLDDAQAIFAALRQAAGANADEAVDNQGYDELQMTAKIDVFAIPLEKVARYGGFTAWVKAYDLLHGKEADEESEQSQESRIAGTFKGNVLIYPISDDEFNRSIPDPETDPKLKAKMPEKDQESPLYLAKLTPPGNNIAVFIRCYILRGINLHPQHAGGKADSFIMVHLGSQERSDKDNVVKNTLNPVFGRCFEFEAIFPKDSMLNISIYDHDVLGRHHIIGETRIDLENRFWSKHRATCGLSQRYELTGYNRWRDTQTPMQILAKLCKDYGFKPPAYEQSQNRVHVHGKDFFADPSIDDESGKLKMSSEPLALEALLHWPEVGPNCVPLLREHVESRPLYSPERPGIEQGRLEMWVDLFQKELGTPPPAVVCTPRLPKKYELRCIIWNTKEVVLGEESFLTGERSVDIVVKGWVQGAKLDMQTTDVHYRSSDGDGMFNWRFVFKLEYLKAEDCIIVRTKDSLIGPETESKKKPQLTLQIWDANLIGSDDFLGTVELRLSRLPRGAPSSKACSHLMLSKYYPYTVNIFKTKRSRGFWPVIGPEKEGKKKKGFLGMFIKKKKKKKKKNKRVRQAVTGKIEAELALVLEAEAESAPVGLGRAEPEPLDEPNRPELGFLNFINPLKMIKKLICGAVPCIIKILIIALIVLFIALFLYNVPQATITRLINSI